MTELSIKGQWACWYASTLGVPVFPIWGVVDGVCECGQEDCDDAGKHPIGILVGNGVLRATTNEVAITRWWERYPNANIGLATGHVFDVLDLDYFLEAGEVEALADADTVETDDPIATIFRHGHNDLVQWLARGELGPASRTGHGRHVLVQPTGFKNKAGEKYGLPAHVDYRGLGGYIVAPPSTHRSGTSYQWLDDFPPTLAIPEAPAALIALLDDAENRVRRPSITERLGKLADPVAAFLRSQLGGSGDRSPRYAQAALEAEAAEVAGTTKGGRNDRLNVAALKLGRYVISGELDEAQVYAALLGAAEKCGLPSRASEKTIASGLFGATKPVAA